LTSTVLLRAKSASRTIPLILIAAGGAAVVGLLANSASSKIIAGAVGALLLGALIARAPEWTFGACLLVLCYSPEYMGPAAGVFGQPQLQKGIVYFAALGMALHRGVRPRFLIVPAAYAVMAVLAKLNGQLIAGLTLTQMLSSFVTLTVGWTALAINWDRNRDMKYLKILAFLPVACVLLGVVLQAAGVHPVFDHGTGFDSTTRLQGASGPAQLALTSFIACVTASICYRMTRWRWAPLVLVLSGSSDKRWVPQRWARIAIVCVAAAGVASLVVPSLLSRQSNATYIPGQGVIYDKTSGRDKAWSEFYAIAKQSPLFGHGLGAGPITKIKEKGFLAQHNEYLRLFLEGGYIGGGIVFLAMIMTIASCIRLAPARIRMDLVGLVLGFAILSYTDNTLTSVNLQVPFCIVFGILASYTLRRRRAAPVQRQPAVMPPLEPPVPVAG
jgi:teichuronic acid biosynthesis protein TuaE